MEINKVQWRMIAKGEKLPCDSFLMKKDGTITSMVTGAGVTVGQDAYYLPVEELRSFPKEESEDERIRKWIIGVLSTYEHDRDLRDTAIAWLEKQGEQNPAWSGEDESLCRQIEGILSVCRTKSLLSPDLYKKMLGLLKSLKERVQPQTRQGWSEEDEENLKWFEKFFRAESVFAEGKNIPQDRYLWFKNLKGRVQSKQEWSEEDKKISTAIYESIDISILNDFGVSAHEAAIWLKSLRPQSHWKPSDEQMEALKYSTYCPNEQMSKVLFELYQDLQKLKS